MKRALRNPDTSMFIKPDLGETGLIEQARSFDNYKEAIEFCKDNRLNRVELVVRVSDDYEFAVDVPALAPIGSPVVVSSEVAPMTSPAVISPDVAPISPVVAAPAGVWEPYDAVKTYDLDAA